MFIIGDKSHLKAMNEMKELSMKSSDAHNEWFDNKRKEFNVLSEND